MPDARYPNVDPQPRFPEIEKRVLAYCSARGSSGNPSSGGGRDPTAPTSSSSTTDPPFANGLPH